MPSSTSSSDAPAEAGPAKRRLGALVAVFVALNALALVAWQAIPFTQVSEERYLAAVEDHLAMLERSKGEADRVVILGGSDVAFSISAETLAAQLDRPVYNGGIQGSIDFRNLVDLYLPHLDPERDLIVVVVEPNLMTEDERYSQTWCDVIYLRRDLSGLVRRPRCVPQIVKRTFDEVRYHIGEEPPVDPVYRRSGFNAVGDQTAHLAFERDPPDLSTYSYSALTDPMVSRLEGFVQRKLTARGFEVLYVPSVMPDPTCNAERGRLEGLIGRLSQLSTEQGPTLALDPFCFSQKMFFDTAGHLKAAGRDIQTDNVHRAIKYAADR